jgi:hypothetical protein
MKIFKYSNKFFAINFFVITILFLSACSKNESKIETPKIPTQSDSSVNNNQNNTGSVDQGQANLNAGYLIAHDWVNTYTGLAFGEPNKVREIINSETDCQPDGTFKIVNNKVEIEFNKCGEQEFTKQLLTLALSNNEDRYYRGEEDLRYREFLIDQNGRRYYNTSSTYPPGTMRDFVQDGWGYQIELIASQPKLADEILLYKNPTLDSPYYIYSEYDGSNITKGLVSIMGKYNSDGETWYLVDRINLVMGDLQLKSPEGAVIEKFVGHLPYTWLNGKYIKTE